MIPFIVNDLTRAVNPIKLREMLAAGCPVVSTNLPEVEKLRKVYESGISVAETADEFVRLVRRQLDNPKTKEQKQAISSTMKDETWELKVRRIAGLINEVRAAAALEGNPRERA
jgi:glycosyltransferase involved in cell wall biosynthesis